MSFHRHIRILDNIIKHRRGLNVSEFTFSIDNYINTETDMLYVNVNRYCAKPYVAFNWRSRMYFTLFEDHFMFSTKDNKSSRWSDDFEINYNIEREFFEQIKFVVDLKTFDYKTLKHLISIKNEFFKAYEYDRNKQSS